MAEDTTINVDIPIQDSTQSIEIINFEKTSVEETTTVVVEKALENKNNSLVIIAEDEDDDGTIYNKAGE